MILPLCVFIIPLCYRIYPLTDAYSGITGAMFLCLGSIFFLYALFVPLKAYLHFNYVDLLALCFLLYTLFNSVLKQPNHICSNDNILLTAAIFLYPALKLSFQHKKAELALLVLVLFAGLFVQCIALLQLIRLMPVINFVYKATGVFYNPNMLCTYLSVQFPLILFGLLKSKRLIIKLLCGINCGGTLFFNMLLLSRAAFLAMLIVSIVLLLKAGVHKKYRRPALIAASVILLAGLLVSIQIKTGSSKGRLLIWKISAGMLSKYPVFGSGFGTYKSRYNLYQAQYFKSAEHTQQDVLLADENYEPFNDYLGIDIEDGITGLLLFAGILFAVFFYSGKTNGFPVHLFGCILVFAIISLFSYPLGEPFLFLEFIAFVAILSAYVNGRNFPVNYAIKIAAILVALVCLDRFFYTDQWLTIKNKVSNNAGVYASLYPHLKNNPDFLQDYAGALGDEKNYRTAINMSKESRDMLPAPLMYERLGLLYYESGIADSAENNFKQAAMIVPGKLDPKYTLFNYYKATHNLIKAKQTAENILGMNAKIPSTEADMIRADVKVFLKNINKSATDSAVTH